MSYYPAKHTIAWRVMQLFEESAPGLKLGCGAIADELGQPTSSVRPCLEPCVKHGLLTSVVENGIRYYMLGDRTPLQSEYPADSDPEDKPQARIVKHDADDPIPAAEVPLTPTPLPELVKETPFSFSFHGNGDLELSKGNQHITLTRYEWLQLQQFIDVMQRWKQSAA